MIQEKVRKVVIAGGGTAGWLAAAALSIQLKELLEITLIESEDIGTVGVGEATIPPMRVFHRLLRIDEQEFMRATEATFKLGIGFENWGKIGDSYIHSFGKTGKETWMAEFVHFWLRAKQLGFADEFGAYCLEWQAAKDGKFATGKQSELNFAYHLDAGLYARFLRNISEKNGVRRVEGKIATVDQEVQTGFIQSIRMESGEVVDGDLFIDCTGFRGLLIEQTLKTGYQDWGRWLICDSAVAVQTESTGPALPYTRSIALEAGWRWRIPLQHRVGNGIVYSSRYMSDDEATQCLLQQVDGPTITTPRVIKFKPGKRNVNWNKNCVALGLASGFIEPLESTSIHLIMMGVTRLMQMFPFDGINQTVVDEFNTQSAVELEKIRDFIILHYKQTERDDSPFWRYCKDMEIPGTLQQRIDLFRKNAQAFQKENELFRVDSWTQVMLGQRLEPESYHRFVDIMPAEDLRRFLESMKRMINEKVSSLPSHHAFVSQYCAREKM